ncbi:hypothetical protein [Streptomyces griseoruber]|uniref:Uncharacterized protein n=1 Tax=Streptomyces griseoruber TaxID=1943 RepID=A0A101T7Q3_9ACTN|nr:hypothetical protein [Streptomyces griseoruber]KUN87412.1 hypothetical protein AQJ64_04455 [Streptomyces griseoruber]
MRLFRALAPVTAAVALVLCAPHEALPHEHPDPFGAECRITVDGSHVVAHCHNPYADTDRVTLHIECARWWDLDTDGTPVDAGPALTVRLTGRCWKEVGRAWITHEKV